MQQGKGLTLMFLQQHMRLLKSWKKAETLQKNHKCWKGLQKFWKKNFQELNQKKKKTLSKTIFVWLNQAADSAELAGNKKRSIQLRLKAVEFAFKRKNNADKEK